MINKKKDLYNMNKIDPQMTENKETNLGEINMPPPIIETEITNFIDIIKKQADVNNKIISVLSNPKISQEQKKKMTKILSQGAQNSSFFINMVRNKEKMNNLFDGDEPEINTSIPEKTNVVDPFNKVKNIIISLMSTIDPSIAFRNPKQPDWYEVGYQAHFVIKRVEEKAKTTFRKLFSFLKVQSTNIGVLIQETKEIPGNIENIITLIGEKKNVKFLEKKFSKSFSLLGININDMLSSSVMSTVLTEDELKTKIETNLSHNFSAIKNTSNNQYSFTALNNLTPELKQEMLTSILFPKILNSIKENISINSTIEVTKNDNRYIKVVLEFAKENNFNPDLVIHSLKNHTELLSGYIGIEKLLKNKDKIIENADKYSVIIGNNVTHLKELMLVVSQVGKEIELTNTDPKQKELLIKEINDSVVFEKDGNKITLQQIRLNILSLDNQTIDIEKKSDLSSSL